MKFRTEDLLHLTPQDSFVYGVLSMYLDRTVVCVRLDDWHVQNLRDVIPKDISLTKCVRNLINYGLLTQTVDSDGVRYELTEE